MIKIHSAKCILTMIAAACVLAACTSQQESPDPVAVQQEIAANLANEADLVRSTVSDTDRANRVVGLLRERDRVISRHVKELVTYRQDMAILNDDYDAKRESFDQLLSAYNTEREAAQKELLGIITAMKKQTTAKEWQVISKYQLKRLHPRQNVYPDVKGGG